MQNQTEKLRHTVQLIKALVDPEMVFLLGISYSLRSIESIFIPEPARGEQESHCYLLVLTGPEDKRNHDAIQESIEKKCCSVLEVTAIVQGLSQFNDWLRAGHSFALFICRYGICLHDSGKSRLPPIDFNTIPIGPNHGETEIDPWFRHAREFMAGAELYRLRKEFGLAAFMLHQATEHSLIGILLSVTGFRANTHNLGKLLCYCGLFSSEPEMLFPRNSKTEMHIFQLLQKAYIHPRYKNDYWISEAELGVLEKRIGKLILFSDQFREPRGLHENPQTGQVQLPAICHTL
jgi:HEPN domain-containing protein